MTPKRIRELREFAVDTGNADLFGMLEEALQAVEALQEQLAGAKSAKKELDDYLEGLREEFLDEDERHLDIVDGVNLTVFRLYDALDRVEEQRDEVQRGTESDCRRLRLENERLENELDTATDERDRLRERFAELDRRHTELVGAWRREMRIAARAVLSSRQLERELEKREEALALREQAVKARKPRRGQS